jgi:hypothetical protein
VRRRREVIDKQDGEASSSVTNTGESPRSTKEEPWIFEATRSSRDEKAQLVGTNSASVSSTLENRVAHIESQLRELSERLRRLEALREREICEKAEIPVFHRGHPVIGRLPIWGSGRSLIVMKTGPDTFELDIV